MLESLFGKVAVLKVSSFIKKRLQILRNFQEDLFLRTHPVAAPVAASVALKNAEISQENISGLGSIFIFDL